MIITEQFSENLVRHYSDKGVKIKQVETGLVYEEAIDLIPCEYAYEETNEPVGQDELEIERNEGVMDVNFED